jgi:hypothetical protein
MKTPAPCEPVDPGVVVIVKEGGTTHVLNRKRDRHWNLLDYTDGALDWNKLWQQYEDVEILTRKPVPGRPEYQYSQEGVGDVRSFCCRTAEYSAEIARDHEAWRTVTWYDDTNTSFVGPWLTFPWAVTPAMKAA